MSKTNIEVRQAVYEDLNGIHETARIGFEESGGHLPDAEYPYILQFILQQISAGLVWVAVDLDTEEVIGCTMLSVNHWPWNRQVQFFQNDHLFVLDGYRGTNAADDLVTAIKRHAAEHDAQLLINFTYGIDTRVSHHFMKKHDGKLLGGNYLFDLSSNV